MPIFIAIPYILTETLAFWLVARWLGVGWALLLLLLFFFGGLLLAAVEMRRIAVKLSRGRVNAGRGAGDYGLVAAGALGVAMPGFITTIIGLLLIISPTRAVVRGILARKMRRKIEDLGVRGFEAANRYRPQTSYGSFVVEHDPTRDSGAGVPDDREIQQWSSDVKPEDFLGGGGGGHTSGGDDGGERPRG
ncbi:FxsA family protein [Corynebacterium pygosceleis]|uniref:FxsA family protein n=1 Tax=Corynebacterium pygosceleis TaxID=2800406 RepID=UPI0020039CFA|nr:FxsA family protein [Corynebacterium pygosceleis]